MKGRLGVAAAALVAAAAGGFGPGSFADRSQTVVENSTTPAKPGAPAHQAGDVKASALSRFFRSTTGMGGTGSAGGYRSREGWTNARYQRAAHKRRNVIRNRKQQRGR